MNSEYIFYAKQMVPVESPHTPLLGAVIQNGETLSIRSKLAEMDLLGILIISKHTYGGGSTLSLFKVATGIAACAGGNERLKYIYANIRNI